MEKKTAKDKLLAEGLRVVHRHGFAGSSVRDVVSAAGVSQGSFTQHFASKEDFGLQIIALYSRYSEQLVAATLGNSALSPLARIRAYVDGHVVMMKRDSHRSGCLYGNFAAEVPSAGEIIRKDIAARLAEREHSVAACVTAAIEAGELPSTLDAAATAGFVISALQGALLLSKAQHSGKPLDQLVQVLFSTTLARR